MVRVVVVVVGGGGGGKIVHPLDDLVAQSGTNNLGRSQNSKNPDPKSFLLQPTCFEKITKKHKFKVQGVLRQKIL